MFDSRPEGESRWAIKRSGPRFRVLAVVELSEPVGAFCVEARLKEISRKGCYVNTPNTIAVGTVLRVVISSEDLTFETNGKVLYVHEGVGMGILFIDTSDDQIEMLTSWLSELAGAAVL
jgi:hypothetical protein